MMHYYLLFNMGIALSYGFSYLILTLPIVKAKLSQAHQLMFMRHCFLLAPILLLIMPLFVRIYPAANSSFEFKPIIIHASNLITTSQHVADTTLTFMPTPTFELSLLQIVGWLLLLGFTYCLMQYIHTQIKLRGLLTRAYRAHKIHNVSVLFSNEIDTPFCFARLNQHYVMLPTALLEHPAELRLALRHELQHIRQHDTYWLQLLALVKVACSWNPLFILWIRWSEQLQEFACDETIILRQRTATPNYAQCLINAALAIKKPSWQPTGVIGINHQPSILTRRVTMLFHYKKLSHKCLLGIIYAVSSLSLASTALAVSAAYDQPITSKKLTQIIKKTAIHPEFHVKATPEVVTQINNIRNSSKAREQFSAALTRMKKYQSTIEPVLRDRNMPLDLMVIPLVESGYRPLKESENPAHAAGIWQFIPDTAKNMGLTINSVRDDRLDTTLATDSALYYLQKLYTQFKDWKLAAMAYEIGENETQRLIDTTKSRDAWTIARSKHVPKRYKKDLVNYLATLDASMIIMHDKKLIAT